MNYLKNIWADRVPNFDSCFLDLFENLANKGNDGGDKDEKTIESGKVFSTYYELYIYAFFIGLYSDHKQESIENKANFGYKISEWGKKNRKSARNPFAQIQEYMFISLIERSEIDFINLERGDDADSTKAAVSELLNLMELYANGGLQLIREKLQENINYFVSSAVSPLNFFLEIQNGSN